MKAMKSQLLAYVASAALAFVPAAANAAQAAQTASPAAMPAVAAPAATLSAMAAVSSFYNQYKPAIWFKGGAVTPAAAQLVTILRRAPDSCDPAPPRR